MDNKEEKKCLNLPDFDCADFYSCCSCGGGECGCRYCWDCGACENCKG